jgi:transcription antitermination factor NusA-like protein
MEAYRGNKESDVANYFLNKVYNPIAEKNPVVARDCDKINAIDSNGLKTRVFMRELRGVGLKTGYTQEKPTRDLKDETRNFSEFLYTIATSERGAKYPLNFIGRKIKVGILLVASFETLAMHRLHVHKGWLKKKNEMGVETTYILAFGYRNVELARQLAQWAQNEGLVEIVQNQPFVVPARSGKAERTIVITCHSTQARADTLLDPEEELRAILIRCIPAVAAGDVEVLDTAREPGIQSKVIVRSVVKNIDPVWVCIGKNEETLKKVLDELGEFVRFIAFSDDPKIFLVECLNIPSDKVRSVEIDSNKKQAKVIVEDRESASIAIGSKGSNVRLVKKITGLDIQILNAGQAENLQKPEPAKSPEELLKQAVIQEIPEVANGTITIKDMVREPGIQSKVVVRQPGDPKTSAAICMGPNRQHVDALVKKLGERVFFIEFHEDMESYLVACLGIYPNRVLSINIKPTLKTADILVTKKDVCARAIGENGINVKQSAQLTGLRYIQIRSQEQ